MRKRKKSNKVDPNSKYWKTKADREFSLFIRNRDGECVYCHSKEHLQCSHLFPREELATRWSKWNALTLCARHHKMDRKWSFHRNPVRFFDWLEQTRPYLWKILKDACNMERKVVDAKEAYAELKEANDKCH